MMLRWLPVACVVVWMAAPLAPSVDAVEDMIARGTILLGNPLPDTDVSHDTPWGFFVPLERTDLEWLRTRTTDHGGAGHAMGMAFHGAEGRLDTACVPLGMGTALTPSQETLCAVPDGATGLFVYARHGIHLEVLVLAVAAERLEEDFEAPFDWTLGAHVPSDPNRPGETVAWNISQSDILSRSGNQSIRYRLDGSQDDGTIWISQAIPVESGRSYLAEVSAWAWSRDQSDNEIAHIVMRIGPTPAEDEDSFPKPRTIGAIGDGYGLRDDLNQVAGWNEYRFGWDAGKLMADVVHVSVGVSVVWETPIDYHIDDVSVRLVPYDG